MKQQSTDLVVYETLLGHHPLPHICLQCRLEGAAVGFPAQQPLDRVAACTMPVVTVVVAAAGVVLVRVA